MLYSPFSSLESEVFGKTAPPSDVTNFSMVSRIDLAELMWEGVADLDVINGGTYWVRHTSNLTGATWAGSSDITKTIPGTADSFSVPLMSGSYLIKALDSSGNESTNAAIVTSNVASILALNAVYTSTQHTDFGSTTADKGINDPSTTNVTYDSSNDVIKLTDTSVGTGYYYFADNPIDLGSSYTSRLTSAYTSTGFAVSNLFDSAAGNFDSMTGLFDGAEISGTNTAIEIRTTLDDPSGTPTWSSWSPFFVGDYVARGIEFRAKLESSNASNNVQISNLAVTIDMPDTMKRGINEQTDSGTNNGTKVITYPSPFKATPSVGITATNSDDKIFYTISSNTSTGFTITFYDNNTSQASQQTFNWLSSGY